MSLLKRIKIRSKLLTLIVIMLIGMLIVGIIGYYYNNQSSDALTSIYKNNMASIDFLSDMRQQSRANFANILKIIYINDEAYQKKVLADIQTRTKAFDEALQSYQKTILKDYEIKKLETLQRQLKGWRELFENEIQLVTSGKTDQAEQLFRESSDQTFENLQTTIKDLQNFNIKEADSEYEKNSSQQKASMIILLVVIVAVTVISILLGIMITRVITNPLKKIVGLIKKTSDFNLVNDESLNSLSKHTDELGDIFKSVSDMRKDLREMVSQIISISNNLTAHSEELTASTEETTKVVNQVATAISEIAEGNSTQAESVNKTSETIQKITQNIGEVNEVTLTSAENAVQSLELVSEGQSALNLTTDIMQDSISVSGNVSNSINELSDAISKVGNITNTINSIAQQTNLLALNAAIEAARAGEAGKGFAVVAEEIRKLAEGSSSAVGEINSIIKDIINKNSAASQSMEKTKELVSQQESSIKTTREAFEKIKTSVDAIVNQTKNTSDMLKNIDMSSKEVNNHTQDMAAIAQQSAASSEEISASSEEQLASIELIAKASNDLSKMAVDLNNQVNKFKI